MVVEAVAQARLGVGDDALAQVARLCRHALKARLGGGIVADAHKGVSEVVFGNGEVGRAPALEVFGQQLDCLFVFALAQVGLAEQHLCLGANLGIVRAQGVGLCQLLHGGVGVTGDEVAGAQGVEHALLGRQHAGVGIFHAFDGGKGGLVVVVGDIAGDDVVTHIGGVGAVGEVAEEVLEGGHARAKGHRAAAGLCHGVVVVGVFACLAVVVEAQGAVKGHDGAVGVVEVHQRQTEVEVGVLAHRRVVGRYRAQRLGRSGIVA